MPIKSVAFFIPDFSVGGVEKSFICYANAIVGRYRVSFIVLKKNGELVGTLNPRIDVLELGVSRIRYSFPKLMSILSHNKFDCIITGTEITNIYSVLANKILRNKSKVITSQHNFFDSECSTILFRYFLPWAHKNASKVYAVSYAIKEMLVEMGVGKGKVSVLYNPINVESIKNSSVEYNVPTKEKYILYVGRIYPVKNLQYLIRSFKLMKEKKSDIKLVVVGDGALKNDMVHLAEELKLEGDILWTGSLSNPYPYIKNAEVLVVPSLSESFSIVVAEAMCLGKTVVSTPCKGPMEIIQNDYGYISDSFTDAQTLCDSIVKALDEKIDSDCLTKYSIKFSDHALTRKLIQLIEN